MKTSIKIIILLIIAGVIGGFIYWQYNKKKIVGDSINKTIASKTDSLYFIKYDSSSIDEVNGNVAFYNVVLQSDDEQKRLLNSTDSLPNALYNIRIEKVAASGIDVAGLIKTEKVAAKKILLVKPVIQIINTGEDREKPFTMNDTLALYRRILGKFKSIEADTIQIENGSLLITNKAGKAMTTLENINIRLNKFLVDRTKNYHSIISYFIKDVRLTVENIQLPASKNNTRINIEKVDYNALARSLNIGAIRQYKVNDLNPVSDLRNIRITGLNTDAFILQAQLKAVEINCDGGVITIYTKAKKGNTGKGDQSIELSSDVIDQAQISAINLGNTKIIIINKDDPKASPFVLTNAKFKVLTPVKISEGSTVNNLINNAQWELSAGGFSFDTKNKMYKISVGDFVVNKMASTVKLNTFSVRPLLSEQQFVKHVSFQQDQYDLTINNISFKGVNIKNLLLNKVFEAEEGSIEPILKVFNDKTLPAPTKSKVGNYPHQLIQKLDVPIYIKTIRISKGLVSYRERAEKSALIGRVFFTGLNGSLSNVTNMPAKMKANNIMTVRANAKFLGEADLSTTWQLPMDTKTGAFKIKGELKSMDALKLNTILEPLAMATVKKGQIDKVVFDMAGGDLKADAKVTFLYHDLKLDILKKDEEDNQLKKKGLISVLANTIIKNENTKAGNSKQVTNDRIAIRSFFNLVWKTIYVGVKSTALGKKGNNESAK